MRTAIGCLLMLCLGAVARGQCSADAGIDTVLCGGFSMQFDTIQLGGDPVVTGGTAPYTYTWSAYVDMGWGWSYSASDMLDDTTAAHPFLVNPIDETWYTLTVTDTMGNSCVDSVFVGLSVFGTNLGYLTVSIVEGDSFQFFAGENLDGNYPPLSYVWHPNESLSDSTSLTAWASPTEYTAYYLTATDAAGCTGTAAPLYFVSVLPLALEDVDRKKIRVIVQPVPVRDRATIRVEGMESAQMALAIYNASGQVVLHALMPGGSFELDRTGWASGPYTFRVLDAGRMVGDGRFIVE